MSDKQELNMEDMSQAAGGWEFHAKGEKLAWLNGYDVTCPYCGNASEDVVKKRGANPGEVQFWGAKTARSLFAFAWTGSTTGLKSLSVIDLPRHGARVFPAPARELIDGKPAQGFPYTTNTIQRS